MLSFLFWITTSGGRADKCTWKIAISLLSPPPPSYCWFSTEQARGCSSDTASKSVSRKWHYKGITEFFGIPDGMHVLSFVLYHKYLKKKNNKTMIFDHAILWPSLSASESRSTSVHDTTSKHFPKLSTENRSYKFL